MHVLQQTQMGGRTDPSIMDSCWGCDDQRTYIRRSERRCDATCAAKIHARLAALGTHLLFFLSCRADGQRTVPACGTMTAPPGSPARQPAAAAATPPPPSPPTGHWACTNELVPISYTLTLHAHVSCFCINTYTTTTTARPTTVGVGTLADPTSRQQTFCPFRGKTHRTHRRLAPGPDTTPPPLGSIPLPVRHGLAASSAHPFPLSPLLSPLCDPSRCQAEHPFSTHLPLALFAVAQHPSHLSGSSIEQRG